MSDYHHHNNNIRYTSCPSAVSYVYLYPTYITQFPLGDLDCRAIWTTPPHNLQKNERLPYWDKRTENTKMGQHLMPYVL
jgi:hypothetical protein